MNPGPLVEHASRETTPFARNLDTDTADRCFTTAGSRPNREPDLEGAFLRGGFQRLRRQEL